MKEGIPGCIKLIKTTGDKTTPNMPHQNHGPTPKSLQPYTKSSSRTSAPEPLGLRLAQLCC